MAARVIYHDFDRSSGSLSLQYDPALLAIIEIIRDGLIRDSYVRLHQFGTFRLKWSKPGRGRHPGTGEPISWPAQPRVTFTPAKHLRDLVDPDPQPVIEIDDEDTTALPHPEHEDIPVLQVVSTDITINTEPEKETTTEPPGKPPHRSKRMKTLLAGAGLLALVPVIIMMLQTELSQPRTKSSTQAASVTPVTEPAIRLQHDETPTIPQNVKPRVEAAQRKQAPSFHLQPTVHVVQTNDNLWSLAETYLGDAYLWPLIYRANRRTLDHPDKLVPGRQLVIPGLQQPADTMSGHDRQLAAESYLLLYHYFNEKQAPNAYHFLVGASKYDVHWLKQQKSAISRQHRKYLR